MQSIIRCLSSKREHKKKSKSLGRGVLNLAKRINNKNLIETASKANYRISIIP